MNSQEQSLFVPGKPYTFEFRSLPGFSTDIANAINRVSTPFRYVRREFLQSTSAHWDTFYAQGWDSCMKVDLASLKDNYLIRVRVPVDEITCIVEERIFVNDAGQIVTTRITEPIHTDVVRSWIADVERIHSELIRQRARTLEARAQQHA